MKIGIFANLDKDLEGRATTALVEFLLPRNFEVYVSEQLECLQLPVRYCDNATLAACDIVVVFGGDGTILRIAKECARTNAKIFAVNLGHRGFLAAVEYVELSNIFNDIASGNYVLDTRNLINVTAGENIYLALNEAVIARGAQTKMLKTEVRVNGALADKYASDGVIVSTPTGSTAYSLSAGGPIIAPDVNAVLITPICAHSLHSRPMVINSDNTIWIKLLRAETYAYLNIDGDDVQKLQSGDIFLVTKSEYSVSFIRLKKYNYYEKLLQKMRYWSSFDK